VANRIFRNNKNGNTYELTGIALDCTNKRADDKIEMAVYKLCRFDGPIYTRDMSEFKEKFTEL
jgi:hypothetical protein